MFTFGRPDLWKLQEMWQRESAARLTYPEVGATAGDELPAGYRHFSSVHIIGTGENVFDRSATHVEHFGMQAAVGLQAYPDDGVTDGATFLFTRKLVQSAYSFGVRIVYVIHTETERGFAYGTLPSHPLAGEEYFGIGI